VGGIHIIEDMGGCNQKKLDNVAFLEKTLTEAATLCGATILNCFSHKFNPCGVSIVLTLKESHFSIHTWPEHNYAATDFYSCSDNIDAEMARDYVKEKIEATVSKSHSFNRGRP
jgi:S-adenosylmethionine decarboxylase